MGVVGAKCVQYLHNLGFHSTDAVFKVVFVGIEEIGEVLIISGTNPLVRGKAEQVSLHFFQKPPQGMVHVLDLSRYLDLDRLQLLFS